MIRTKPDLPSRSTTPASPVVECLVSCRPEGAVYAGFWEFPGGKAHCSESVVACAVREAREELGIEIEPIEPLPVVRHRYPHAHVALHPHLSRLTPTSPEPADLAVASHQWVEIADLVDSDFPEGNRPILAHLRARDAAGGLAGLLQGA